MINDFTVNGLRMRNEFIERGYPRGIVQETFTCASLVNRQNLLQPKRKKSFNQPLSVALDFSPKTYQEGNIIRKHWHIVKHIPRCSLPPLIGFQKQSSIKNI